MTGDPGVPRWWWWSMGVVVVGGVAMAMGVLAVELEWDSIFLLAVLVWPFAVLFVVWASLACVGYAKYGVWRLSVVPVVLAALTVGLVVTAVPSRIAFAVSRGAMEDAARSCPQGFDDGRGREWVGLIRVTMMHDLGDGCLLHTPGGGLDLAGWAWFPGDRPPNEAGYHFTHHDGHWYRFSIDF